MGWDVIQCSFQRANFQLDPCYYKFSNAVERSTTRTLYVTATWVYSPLGTRSCGTDSKEMNHGRFDRVSWFLRAQGHRLMNKRERDTGYQCYRFRWYLNRLHWSNTEAVVAASYVKTKEKTAYFKSDQSHCFIALCKQCAHCVNVQCFISGKQNPAYQLCNQIRIMLHSTWNSIV